MNLTPLFATNLIEDVIDDDELLSKLQSLVDDYEFDSQDVTNKSESSVSKRILSDHPDIGLSILSRFHYANKSAFHYPCNFAITTSWLTKTTRGGYSQLHHHSNSFYSGILYFGDYDEDGAEIKFSSPIDIFSTFYIIPNEWNVHNCLEWSITPQRGTLLFFPSYLKHSIGEHKSDTTRYSLAFNIVPLGEYGDGDSTYSTKWFT